MLEYAELQCAQVVLFQSFEGATLLESVVSAQSLYPMSEHTSQSRRQSTLSFRPLLNVLNVDAPLFLVAARTLLAEPDA